MITAEDVKRIKKKTVRHNARLVQKYLALTDKQKDLIRHKLLPNICKMKATWGEVNEAVTFYNDYLNYENKKQPLNCSTAQGFVKMQFQYLLDT